MCVKKPGRCSCFVCAGFGQPTFQRRTVGARPSWLSGSRRFSAHPGMRRLKLAVRTFMLGFSENDLGQRIHQFVRAVADGVANSWRTDEFKRRSALFVGSLEEDTESCRELYVMRSNAEHFNDPDEKIEPHLSIREGLIRGCRRAFQAESLARYCFTRIVERPELWDHFGSKERLDAFWKLDEAERVELWGPPMDLSLALSSFDPTMVADER